MSIINLVELQEIHSVRSVSHLVLLTLFLHTEPLEALLFQLIEA